MVLGRVLELEGYKNDGSTFPVELSLAEWESGGQIFFTAIIRDISARKRAESELLATETRYRRLFEAARDGILILDADNGSIIDVNPFLIELLGYTREEFLGKKIWNLVFSRILLQAKTILKHCRKTNISVMTIYLLKLLMAGSWKSNSSVTCIR